jgi:hypothetical protein
MSTNELPEKGRIMATEQRTSEQGTTFDATLIQSFIRNALSDDAVSESVNDLLLDGVIRGKYHPSVIAESLRPIIEEVLETATFADWSTVADGLIADARETLADTAAAPASPR